MICLLLCCLAALGQGALSYEYRISTVSDLIQFSKIVNSGFDYSGTTVFLGADIDFSGVFSEQFEPIGKCDYNYYFFQGTFDGQGHTISSLAMNSSSRHVGLFGYSSGATIRNVVLDSSCSVNSYRDSSFVYVGGIIAYCSDCTIENIVNMASVSFTGNANNYLYFGGIIGYLYASNKDTTVRNCANYGSVTQSGTAGSSSRIGGVVGYSQGSLYIYYIQNCLNLGTITHSGTTTTAYLYLGGIIGDASASKGINSIENCVSGGKIISSEEDDCYIGSVVGYASSSTTKITHCYWSSDVGYNKVCGYGSPIITESTSFNSATFKLSKTVSVGNYTGASLLYALNAAADYYHLREYSNWLLNKDNKKASFTINSRAKSLTLDTELILLPSLANEGKLWFDGWYTDSSCTQPLTDFEITSDTPLYGEWEENNNNYTITFNTRGGSPVPEPFTEQFGSVVNLTKNTYKERFAICFWETDYGDRVPFDFTVPAHNITLRAVWVHTYISAVEDFTDFSKVVNSGVSYSGTTVFLDADIDFSGGFSEQFEPIGNSDYNFQGTFNGQGHTISNLAINSSSRYVGLFGYSTGATIRNVVLDSSCSVMSSYSGTSQAYAGGIIGHCKTDKGPCVIENTVNMASVAFTGNTSSSLNLGGIVGYLSASNKDVIVKNCANYGSVTHSGTAGGSSRIGGIVGSSSNKIYVQNCLNYGTINHNGTSSILYIGGILGDSSGTNNIENCVCGGRITSSKVSNYIGSVIGIESGSTTIIKRCYWTSDVGSYKACGSDSPTIDNETSQVSLNTTQWTA